MGAGVVRYVLPLSSGFLLLCGGSILSAVCAALYLLLYHCCRALAPRRTDTGKYRQYSSDGQSRKGDWGMVNWIERKPFISSYIISI